MAISNAGASDNIGELTADGKYVSIHTGDPGPNAITTIHSLDGKWRKEIKEFANVKFSADSKRGYYALRDTLYIMPLGTDVVETVAGISSFMLAKADVKTDWLVYREKGDNGKTVIRFPNGGIIQSFERVSQFTLTGDSQGILLYERNAASNKLLYMDRNARQQLLWSGKDSLVKFVTPGNNSGVLLKTKAAGRNRLLWINAHNIETEIWSGIEDVFSTAEDKNGSAIAFMMVSKQGQKDQLNSFWIYRYGDGKCRFVISDTSKVIKGKYVLSNSLKHIGATPFLLKNNGNNLFFYLREILPQADKVKKGSQMDVWSYFDPQFQTAQLFEGSNEQARCFAASVDVATGSLVQLEREDEMIVTMDNSRGPVSSDSVAVLVKFKPGVVFQARPYHEQKGYLFYEYNWNNSLETQSFLISLVTGRRTLLQNNVRAYFGDLPNYAITPKQKYIIWYEAEKGNYFSADLQSGKISNISADLIPLKGESDNSGNVSVSGYYRNWVPQHFEENERSVLIRDKYSDIWKLDVEGSAPPVSLTGGYAKTSKSLIIIPINAALNYNAQTKFLVNLDFNHGDRLKGLLNSGFAEVSISKERMNVLLSPGGKVLYQVVTSTDRGYFLSKETASSPPRVVFTSDFKTFVDFPESSFETRKTKIYSKELLTWRTFDGKFNQGILFKPIGFDSTKKYPVFIHYYELGDRGGRYFDGYSADDAHGWVRKFLERDYLVFVPNIHHDELGQTCYNVYNSVVSGAQYLKRKKYVNGAKMGIYGHSFGGYQTNCLVAQTGMFAAAASSAGYADLVSSYLGDVGKTLRHGEGSAEVGQNRMGIDPWRGQEVYIENSPVFQADKVTTPLLLMHAKDDNNVPYSQSLEYFKALRRNGKKVWLISADRWDHAFASEEHMFHFFDHYLKGAPPRKWMTRGVAARLKGIDNGFDVDSEINTPPSPTIYQNDLRTPDQDRLFRKLKKNKAK